MIELSGKVPKIVNCISKNNTRKGKYSAQTPTSGFVLQQQHIQI